MKKWVKKIIKAGIYILGICMAIVLLDRFFESLNKVDVSDMEEVTYNEFLTLVEEGKVDTVYYSATKEVMSFTILNEDTKDMGREKRDKYNYKLDDYRKTLYPAYDEFRKDMLNADVNLVVLEDSIDITYII